MFIRRFFFPFGFYSDHVHTFFYIKIQFIRNMRLRFRKFLDIFKNHTEARSLDHSGFTASTQWGPILKLLFKNYLRIITGSKFNNFKNCVGRKKNYYSYKKKCATVSSVTGRHFNRSYRKVVYSQKLKTWTPLTAMFQKIATTHPF